MKSLSRAELLALPPVTNLATLGRAFGISEPVTRELHRRGYFESLGIRVLKFGAQWRVVTRDILQVLIIAPEITAAGPGTGPAVPQPNNPHQQMDASNVHSNPTRGVGP